MNQTQAYGRWSQPVGVASVLTEEQAQRAQALRIVREVMEDRRGGIGSTGSTLAGLPEDMVSVAEWVVTGIATFMFHDRSDQTEELPKGDPPPGAVCVEDGCDHPATRLRPLSSGIEEWVCDEHAGATDEAAAG